MEFRIGRKKGDESTVRIVRRLNGDFYGVFGTVEDLCKQELLLGEYPTTMDKWVIIIGADAAAIHQFDDRASVKAYWEGQQ